MSLCVRSILGLGKSAAPILRIRNSSRKGLVRALLNATGLLKQPALKVKEPMMKIVVIVKPAERGGHVSCVEKQPVLNHAHTGL